MGITIEDCIKELLINKEDDTYVLGNETIDFAIDIMRKYKKIQELMVGWYNFNSYEILCAMYKVNLLIGEVAEDEVS